MALIALCVVGALVVWFLFFRLGGTASQPTPVSMAAPPVVEATARPVVPTPQMGPLGPGDHLARVEVLVAPSTCSNEPQDVVARRLAVGRIAI